MATAECFSLNNKINLGEVMTQDYTPMEVDHVELNTPTVVSIQPPAPQATAAEIQSLLPYDNNPFAIPALAVPLPAFALANGNGRVCPGAPIRERRPAPLLGIGRQLF